MKAAVPLQAVPHASGTAGVSRSTALWWARQGSNLQPSASKSDVFAFPEFPHGCPLFISRSSASLFCSPGFLLVAQVASHHADTVATRRDRDAGRSAWIEDP